eukprot:CAMPEP_0116951040 /NCGR_PEP_ID=MMETSP0467-20121206/39860_1 /TAXON_ID=283647 /ORGANISM="Mesodinium pulex, Strain SPMC105" /LENGTH=97 /DNA_ID=CAMNT_0004635965 /DNA_START=272 /DNA_END=565 /DNA_ORIENTATION=-
MALAVADLARDAPLIFVPERDIGGGELCAFLKTVCGGVAHALADLALAFDVLSIDVAFVAFAAALLAVVAGLVAAPAEPAQRAAVLAVAVDRTLGAV